MEDNPYLDGCDTYFIMGQLIYGKESLLIQEGQNEISLKIPVDIFLYTQH